MFVKLYRQRQCLLCSSVNVIVCYPLPSLSMFVKLYVVNVNDIVTLYRQRQCLLCSIVNVIDVMLYRHCQCLLELYRHCQCL